MNREILFRGKCHQHYDEQIVKNGFWVFGGYEPTEGIIIDDYLDEYYVDPETVGQFTGICDKNGTKIFEGDIVKCEYSSGLRIVEWYERGGMWQAMIINPRSHCPTGMPIMSMGWVEVIGNTHDNSELLEVER